MPAKKTKTQKVDEAIAKGHKVADTVKEFTPPAVDGQIEQVEQMVEVGWSMAKIIKGLFSKKQK